MKKDNKNKYETPVIVPLGELARGSGLCGNGSGVQGVSPHCQNGNGPPGDGNSKKCNVGTGPKRTGKP